MIGFPRFLGTLLVNVVWSVGLLPVGLPPGGDALVQGVGVVPAAALGQFWLSVENVNGDVVRGVLLSGVIPDGPLLSGSWRSANLRVRIVMI